MMPRLLVPFCLCVLICLRPAAGAGPHPGPAELLTLDGRSLTLTNYAERRGTAIIFLSARAPMSAAEMETLNKVNARLRSRVLLVGVFPERESSSEVRRFAQRSGFTFPVYRDPGQSAARQLGAAFTPEVFLLDERGALVFHSGIGVSAENGLERAIKALLKGEAQVAPELPIQGTPLAQTAPKREVADPYPAIVFSSELIFERIPDAPAHHCSTIAEAANSDLLVVWYGGSYESADDQALFLSRRKKGRRTWSEPEVLIRDSAQPPGNAVVFRDPHNRIWIVWCRMEASRPLRRGGGWGQTRLLYRTSTNNGMTWSKDALFLGGVMEGLRNVPITLANGEMLLPLGHSFAGSSDHCRSWEHLGAVTGGGQPTVIQRADGSLLTLLRKGPQIMQSESTDGGRSWSATSATSVPNPDAGIAMTRLANGHLVLVFNNTKSARTPLSIARSLDEGRTWEAPLALESNPGEYSYPCIIQTTDGHLHVTYTFRRSAIKHIELNETWLTQLERPN